MPPERSPGEVQEGPRGDPGKAQEGPWRPLGKGQEDTRGDRTRADKTSGRTRQRTDKRSSGATRPRTPLACIQLTSRAFNARVHSSLWTRAWPQGALEASSDPSCRGFPTSIYGAYPGAYLVTCVCLKTYIYIYTRCSKGGAKAPPISRDVPSLRRSEVPKFRLRELKPETPELKPETSELKPPRTADQDPRAEARDPKR